VQPEGRNAGVCEGGQRRGATRVAHEGGGRSDDLGGGRDLSIGHAQQDGVAARRAPAAAQGAVHLYAGFAQRAGERGSHAA
jgi:hypothetical protein